MNLATGDVIALASMAVDCLVAYLAIKTRAEMAELKVYMFENFIPKK